MTVSAVVIETLSNDAVRFAQVVKLNEYQILAAKTDVSTSEESQRHLMLGLFGEAGSVLSVIKKKSRDKSSSSEYFSQATEEIGDLLWYVATAAHHSGLELGLLAKPLSLSGIRVKKAAEMEFSDIQHPRSSIPLEPTGHLEWVLMQLGQDVGQLFAAQRAFIKSNNPKELREAYSTVLRRILDVANRSGLSLEEVARENLKKTSDRWPEDRKSGFPDPFDEGYPSYEQLPRKMSVDIKEIYAPDGSYFVYQTCNGINIGDRLTDNIETSDDYRFHDVFHFAYAAVLGWSPVLRAILRLKRKSNKQVDQNQDGARAILIEEGIATLVYNEAKRDGLFRDVKPGKLSFDLLKTIRSFVKGYEVEAVPYWVWEEAILQGFAAFRYLVEYREATISIDYEARTLRFGPIAANQADPET
ncbi:MazG nucleotide pyrophosphohydrolase domain-containing protein [Qipengyuania aquimaris]|uniref:MazG nucleotide pyrophosphohydrolase domain-containing protein n=1 Tax=Qipengyuania aquimaris TaxID=255984 RepID=UPI001FCFA986|nr:MazG nucleotide pyrophosphohydrolase domain-containing protein [Qipengyuania aquimaris]UOR14676.1 pyrophosphatase [Qipengyuania aquimaris]